MKKIIVDTNIIFSCLLNSQGTIGDIIFNSENTFKYYSNQYMRFEIRKHARIRWAAITYPQKPALPGGRGKKV